jgi:predicted O-methyltransferase YrrM
MTSTRVVTLVAFALGSGGLALLAIGSSTPQVVTGGVMVMSGAIYLVRHFWRESDRRRKEDLTRQSLDASEGRAELLTASKQIESSLRTDAREAAARMDAYTRAVLEYVAQVQLDLQSAQAEIAWVRQRLEQDQKESELDKRRATKDRDLVVSQLSGVIGVYEALNPQKPYPSFGGWSISGDCARRLVELILADHHVSIVEMGSGLSTLLIAQALELLGKDGHCLALDHEKVWLEKTTKLLADHGVSHRADVMHAPLVDTDVSGETFRWYDLTQVELPEEIDLLFVDGPPTATGPLARYPALPLLIDRITPTGIVLMDDADRADERSVVERWKSEYVDLSVVHHSDAKGTVEIRRV